MKIEINFDVDNLVSEYLKDNENCSSLPSFLRYNLGKEIDKIKTIKFAEKIDYELEKLGENVFYDQAKNFSDSWKNKLNEKIVNCLDDAISKYIDKYIKDRCVEKKVYSIFEKYFKDVIEKKLTEKISKMIVINTDEIDGIYSDAQEQINYAYEEGRSGN